VTENKVQKMKLSLKSKLLIDSYLKSKKGVCPLNWAMALALTVVDATALQIQPSSYFTDADFHSTFTVVIHTIFLRISATKKFISFK